MGRSDAFYTSISPTPLHYSYRSCTHRAHLPSIHLPPVLFTPPNNSTNEHIKSPALRLWIFRYEYLPTISIAPNKKHVHYASTHRAHSPTINYSAFTPPNYSADTHITLSTSRHTNLRYQLNSTVSIAHDNKHIHHVITTSHSFFIPKRAVTGYTPSLQTQTTCNISYKNNHHAASTIPSPRTAAISLYYHHCHVEFILLGENPHWNV